MSTTTQLIGLKYLTMLQGRHRKAAVQSCNHCVNCAQSINFSKKMNNALPPEVTFC